MVPLSKQELEEIWETKPYGHFTQLMKSIKGKSKYKIQVRAFKTTEVELGSEELVVFAKDSADAINRTHQEMARMSLARKLEIKSWDNTVKYVARCLGRA